MCDAHVPKVSSPTSPPISPIQGHHPNRVLPNLMTQEWRNKVVKREKRNRYMRRYMRLYRLREKRKRAQTICNSAASSEDDNVENDCYNARRRARYREEEQKLNARRREEEQKKVIQFDRKCGELLLHHKVLAEKLLKPLPCVESDP